MHSDNQINFGILKDVKRVIDVNQFFAFLVSSVLISKNSNRTTAFDTFRYAVYI